MTKDELNELEQAVANVAQHDMALGRVLGLLVSHLASLASNPLVDQAEKLVEQVKEGELNNGN
jgi:hypothetical protein